MYKRQGYKRVMVFCDTKFNTAKLANQLARLGFSVDCLHGDLSQKERNQICLLYTSVTHFWRVTSCCPPAGTPAHTARWLICSSTRTAAPR